jgi:chemotaxis protein MotB
MSHATTKKKRGAAHEEEHENHERWLVTYADMLTLLMVLFIVMFAISQVDQKKFMELRTGMAAGFGAPTSILNGTNGIVADQQVSPTPVNIGGFGGPTNAAAQINANARADATAKSAAAQQEVNKLEQARKAIVAALKAKGLQGNVVFHYDARGLVVTILTNQVIFPSDLATLQPQGIQLLEAIAPALAALPNTISVEGNTNQVGHPKYYPTEWELSVARAVSVVRFLIEHEGIAAKRMSATGNADQRPLLPPNDPRAVTQNRRVEIIIQSTLTADVSALIPALAPAGATS